MHEHVGKSNAVLKYVLPGKDYTRVTRGTGTTLGTTTVTVTVTGTRTGTGTGTGWSGSGSGSGRWYWPGGAGDGGVVDNRFGHRLPYRVCVNNETLCYV